MLTTPDAAPPQPRLGEALKRLLRPAVGLSHPEDVLKDPWLDANEKRAILSSWASDASAVEGRPGFRWLFGTEAPVPLAEVMEALDRLDRRSLESALSDGPPSVLARRRDQPRGSAPSSSELAI